MGVLRRYPLRLVLCLIAVGMGEARAADSAWPSFRGPDANPAVPNGRLPEKWSKTENVEWSAEIPGRGWSSPIVSGHRVFLTTVTTEGKSKPPQIGTEYSNEYAAELMKQGLSEKEVMDRVTVRDIELPQEVMLHYFLYCLELETGKVMWKQEFYSGRPPGGRHRKNSFVSETPVTDGRLVYVYVANLGLYAYDMQGAQAWHTQLEAYPIYLDFGTGASPVLWGNRMLIVNDNERQQFIAAYDTKTGKQIWRTNRDLVGKREGPARSGWVTPYVWRNPQRTEVVTVGPETAVSYDAEGKELWRLSGMSAAPIPSPFAYHGLLYVNGGAGKGLFCDQAGRSGQPDGGTGRQTDGVCGVVPTTRRHVPADGSGIRRGAICIVGEGNIEPVRCENRAADL